MNILVYFEVRDGQIKKSSLEAASAAKKLAEKTGGEVTGLFIGKNIADAAKTAGRRRIVCMGSSPVVSLNTNEEKRYNFPAVMERLGQAVPASLVQAPPERLRELVKSEETAKKVAEVVPDAAKVLSGEQAPAKPLDAVKNF